MRLIEIALEDKVCRFLPHIQLVEVLKYFKKQHDASAEEIICMGKSLSLFSPEMTLQEVLVEIDEKYRYYTVSQVVQMRIQKVPKGKTTA
ncbi:MAG: hypothetical protein ACFFDT_21020 [Candidatus Hodarchaeota archaeon]